MHPEPRLPEAGRSGRPEDDDLDLEDAFGHPVPVVAVRDDVWIAPHLHGGPHETSSEPGFDDVDMDDVDV